VWYIDANGVETLWVGRVDGSAYPAVGYKEIAFSLTATTEEGTVVYGINQFGETPTLIITGTGTFELRFSGQLDTSFSGGQISFSASGNTDVAKTSVGFTRTGPPYSVIFLSARGFDGSLIGPSPQHSIVATRKLYQPLLQREILLIL
jgi:hypothetical protein